VEWAAVIRRVERLALQRRNTRSTWNTAAKLMGSSHIQFFVLFFLDSGQIFIFWRGSVSALAHWSPTVSSPPVASRGRLRNRNHVAERSLAGSSPLARRAVCMFFLPPFFSFRFHNAGRNILWPCPEPTSRRTVTSANVLSGAASEEGASLVSTGPGCSWISSSIRSMVVQECKRYELVYVLESLP
jgi:hypothetical protein